MTALPGSRHRGALLLLTTLTVSLLALAAGLGAGAALGQGEGETAAQSPSADGGKTIQGVGWMGDIDNLNPLIGWSNNVYDVYANEYLLMVGRD